MLLIVNSGVSINIDLDILNISFSLRIMSPLVNLTVLSFPFVSFKPNIGQHHTGVKPEENC